MKNNRKPELDEVAMLKEQLEEYEPIPWWYEFTDEDWDAYEAACLDEELDRMPHHVTISSYGSLFNFGEAHRRRPAIGSMADLLPIELVAKAG
ncbi:MAG: hypothetical protein WCO30_00975 [bacterium]